jgi:hypothetical protein
MSAARRDFLSKKYYAPLLNTLCSRILPLVGEHPVILDAGCGEGTWTTALREALYLFDRLGISSNDTGMTAFLHVGVENASKKRFEAACALETALIAQLRETAPDAIAGDGYPLNLRLLAQRLKDEGHAQALPHSLGLILKGLAGDGRNDHNCPDGRGSITLKRGNDPETVFVALNRSWGALDKTAERRRTAAGLLLAHWLSCLPGGTRGIDVPVFGGEQGIAGDAGGELAQRGFSQQIDPARAAGQAGQPVGE